jgi:hypothetical protein
VPQRIEKACYGGLGETGQQPRQDQIPEVFPNPEAAVKWGFEQGAFQALSHARNAYEKLKREHGPADAYEMATLWVAEVQGRLRFADGEHERYYELVDEIPNR